MYDTTITVSGYTFRVLVEHDDSFGPPWSEHDGHGHVRQTSFRCLRDLDKRPGERVLYVDGGTVLLYDVAEAQRVALRDGWGGTVPGQSARQVAAAAVVADFRRLRDYCDGRWSWASVGVELLDVNGEAVPGHSDWLHCIESDAMDYIAETAQELALGIASGLNDVDALQVNNTFTLRQVADGEAA